jgi:hypothetical protein
VRCDIISEDDDFVRHCADRVQKVVTSHNDDVDLVVLKYHSKGLSSADHVNYVCCHVGPRSPAFIVPLTCWTDPAEQISALRTLAARYPHTTFVTFRDSQLRAVERFDDLITPIQDTILFRGAQPFLFLATLSQVRRDMIVFAHCGALDPVWCGPLSLAVTGHVPVCCGCQKAYERGRRWRKGMPGVRRGRCQETEHCIDVLVVSQQSRAASPCPADA